MQRPALEVADIFRDFGPGWRDANCGHVSHAQLKVMSAIEACRTAALGGYVARCENAECGHTVIAYCSCLMGKIGNGELAVTCWCSCAVASNPAHHYESTPEESDEAIDRRNDSFPACCRRNNTRKTSILAVWSSFAVVEIRAHDLA